MRSLIWPTSILLLASAAHAQREPIKGPMTICFKYSVSHMNADEKIDDWKLGIHDASVRIVGPHGWSHTIVESDIRRVDAASLTLVSAKGNTKRYRLSDAGDYVIFARQDPSDLKEWPLLFGSGPRDSKDDEAFYSRFEVVDRDTVKCGHGFLYGIFFEEDLKPG